MENYRPVALSNFKFKIMTDPCPQNQFIADKLISTQQRGFLNSRIGTFLIVVYFPKGLIFLEDIMLVIMPQKWISKNHFTLFK